MRISKSFIKSSLIYTLAGSLPAASGIILLPFYIHYLSANLYGALSIYLSFSLLTQILVTYSFDSSLYIHFHEFKNNRPKLSVFIGSAFVFILIVGLVIGLILFITGDFLFRLILDDKGIAFFPYGAVSLITGIFQAVFKVWNSLQQTRERPNAYFWSNIIFFSMMALFTISGLYVFPNTLTGPLGGRLSASLIVGIWTLSKVFKEFGIHLDYSWLKKSFGFNNYIFIYQLLQWIINYFDRMLMVFYLPLAKVGIYDFTLKCLLIIEFLTSGLNNSFMPKVVSTIIGQDKKTSTIEINRYYNGLTATVMIMVCLSILGFPIIIEFLNRLQVTKNKEYLEAINYIPYAGLIYLFRGLRLYFVSPYSALKYTKPLPVYYTIVMATKITIMVLLIPTLAIPGVLLASFVSSIVEIVLLSQGLKGKFEFKFNKSKMIYGPVILLTIIFVTEFFTNPGDRNWIHMIYLLCSIIFLWRVYRSEIASLHLKEIF